MTRRGGAPEEDVVPTWTLVLGFLLLLLFLLDSVLILMLTWSRFVAGAR